MNAHLWLHSVSKAIISKHPGFKSAWLPCLGLDDGRIQPSEPTTEEYPGAEDSASDDMGWDAARSYQKSIVSFRKYLRACINAKGEHFEYKLWDSLVNLVVNIFFVFND